MEPAPPLAALLAAAGLATVHLLAGRMRFLAGIPRSRWLSFAGGISVAYVFLHLLPEVAASDEHVGGAVGGFGPVEGRASFLVAMVGLAVFYGLERMALRSRGHVRDEPERHRTGPGVFRVHIGSFALFNLLIGYLLVRGEDTAPTALLVFFVAMALHFVVNDFGLREHHEERYHDRGRWVLAAAVLAGWAVGLATEISEHAVALLTAFLAGGVVLNVLKEELPEKRRSRFWAFALGIAAYSALLLSL